MAWYYKEGDQEIGPISKADLQQLINTKAVNARTLVRSDSTDQWLPLAQLVRGQNKSQSQSQSQPEPVPPPSPGRESSNNETAALAPEPPDFQSMEDKPGGATTGQEDNADFATAVCSQCGRSFPQDQVVTFEGQVVCAACKPIFVQKLREGVGLPTTLTYGGFWIRFAAKMIDGILLAIVQWIILIPLSILMAPSTVQNGGNGLPPGFFIFFGVQMLVSFALPVVYNTYFIGRFGATLGKMACRLRVVTPEGEKVTYMRALGRICAEIISYMILAIGYIMAAFDDEKRALHDRICSTRVVVKA